MCMILSRASRGLDPTITAALPTLAAAAADSAGPSLEKPLRNCHV